MNLKKVYKRANFENFKGAVGEAVFKAIIALCPLETERCFERPVYSSQMFLKIGVL